MRRLTSTDFWARVAPLPGLGACWEWTGPKTPKGYGMFPRAASEKGYAHRFAYEQHIGAIPERMEIDHLCRNRSCVNPSHLESVDHKTNVQRGSQAQKTHCMHGHEFTEANVWLRPGTNHRQCRECNRLAYHNRKVVQQ